MSARQRRSHSNFWLLIAGCVALVVTACANVTTPAQHSTNAPHTGHAGLLSTTHSGLISAGVASGRYAWALTTRSLLLTDDSGTSWRAVTLPGGPAAYVATARLGLSAVAAGSAARFGPGTVWVASIGRDGRIAIARSADAGHNWSISQVTRIPPRGASPGPDHLGVRTRRRGQHSRTTHRYHQRQRHICIR